MKKVLCALLVFLFVLAVLPTEISGWNIPAMAAEPVIMQIAAGGEHSLALFSDGSLYAWGYNKYGQLGDGTYVYQNAPVQIGTGFTAIAAGKFHSLALKGDTLYAWGYNDRGQLGDGSTPGRDVNKNTPVQIGTGFTAISAGGSHSLALKGNNLFAWGANDAGQLDDGTNTDRNVPVSIGEGYTAIAAGGWHSLALKGYTLYAWGDNGWGQLGDGTNINKNTPVLIGTGFTAIAAGYNHSLALKGKTLYAWGENVCGQLGDGTNMPINTPLQIGTGYTAIAAGGSHSLALMGNTLFSYGDVDNHQMGGTSLTISYIPVQIGTGYTVIAAGGIHSLALKGNTLYIWGFINWDQLSPVTYADRNTPTEVKFPSLSTLIMTPTPTLTPGCSTQPPTPTPTPTPTPAPTPTQTQIANVISIAVAQTKVYLKKGSSAMLGVIPVTGDNVEAKLTWKSSDPNTVSVTQTGKVKALKSGSVIITAAADNGKSAKIDVIVGGKAAISINIKNPPPSMTMTAGDELKLGIETKPTNAQGVIIFMSTNEKVISVDTAGRLRALKKGSAIIVAMIGAKVVTLYLKVK